MQPRINIYWRVGFSNFKKKNSSVFRYKQEKTTNLSFWTLCSPKGVTPYLRRRRNMRKRKQRPLFTQSQVQGLEQEFTRNRYVSEEKRAELASTLNLTETQVKTWFQNRRTKWRKEARDEMETALMDSKRRWRNNPVDKQEVLPSSSTTSQSNCATQQSQEFIDLDSYKLKIPQKV